ncbi:DUF5067 domain-containing protein [Senegalia massiliensis]|nr:DUF5067 domain-containing protein [Senegalia massiliensis]
MKKILALFMILLMTFSLIACGDSSKDEDTEDTSVDTQESDAEENKDESKNDVYFKDNEVKIEDLKIKIKETKVIPVGEAGNEYGEKPVFAIWYETTNLTDKEIDPLTAWIAVFTAIQDNDENAINELEVGSLPDENHLDSQSEAIKKDGTVENSIAYELDDLETPVTLVANQGIAGEEIGREEYEIK